MKWPWVSENGSEALRLRFDCVLLSASHSFDVASGLETGFFLIRGGIGGTEVEDAALRREAVVVVE